MKEWFFGMAVGVWSWYVSNAFDSTRWFISCSVICSGSSLKLE